MASKISTTTKDVGLLRQLHLDGQLHLSPEYQRNAVWPRPAKAYLIDTILTGNPIPVIYLQRTVNANTGRIEFTVVDGQQRLSALFDFLDNRFSLTESEPNSPWYRRRWKSLEEGDKEKVLSYDFAVQEISGFSVQQVRDMFSRMNRFVVALNPQEMRHATADGEFKKTVEAIGKWTYWTESKIVSPQGAKRMKSDELAAELLILLSEGPQDKKQSVDFYYSAFEESFPAGQKLSEQLERYTNLVAESLPDITSTLFKRSANFYALVGALSEIEAEGDSLPTGSTLRDTLLSFDERIKNLSDGSDQAAAAYQSAQARQTDNIKPRRARIDILRDVIAKD